MKKILLVALLLVGVVIVLGMAIDIQSRAPIVRSERSPEPAMIFASGRIEGATPEIELRPQLAGRITRVLASEGQLVNEGDVLLQLDDRQYCQETALAEAEVDLAEAQLERLLNGAHAQQRSETAALYRARQAELQRAELTWGRIQELLQEKAVTPQEADNQRMLVATLRGEVEAARARLDFIEAQARPDEIGIEHARIAAAKARLELAKVQEERTRLRAPCNAEVLKINNRAGEMAGPASNEPAVIVADSSRFYVRSYVEELDAPRLAQGMAAKMKIDGLPNQELLGYVLRLSPRMDRKSLWNDRSTERNDTKTREVWIELEPTPTLVIGLRVEVRIDTQSGTVQVADDNSP